MSRPASYVSPGDLDLINSTIKMGIYSHPGEGKTVFWGSGGKDVLFIASDPEGPLAATAQGYEYHCVEAYDWDEMEQVYSWLKHDHPTDFRWVVWDSLTLFQDEALIDDIMVDAVARNKSGEQEPYVPSRREYLINMHHISQMVRQLCRLPYNIGISFHVMTTSESGGDGTLFMPQVQGKNMPSKIAGYLNVVGYMGKAPAVDDEKKIVQTIQWQRQGRYYAKDRWHALGARTDRPTLPKVEGLIEARRTELRAQASSQPASGQSRRQPPSQPKKNTAAQRAAAIRARKAKT